MSAIVVSDELLKDAKVYLDITWDDEATDAQLKGQLRRGIALISAKTGMTSEDFSEDDRAQQLLFDYAMYARSGALDTFVKNYQHELLGLKLVNDVKRGTANAES